MILRSLGPGTYKPEDAGSTKSAFLSSPAYTFGTRHKDYGLDNTPGERIYIVIRVRHVRSRLAPNTYGLPGMLGKTVQSAKRQAPMYTFTGRSKRGGFAEDLQRTPGPGGYIAVFISLTVLCSSVILFRYLQRDQVKYLQAGATSLHDRCSQ